MEILFTLVGFRSVGQHSGKCPHFASLQGLHWALFLMDGSFNSSAERSPTVSAMDQDTIKQQLVELSAFTPTSVSLFYKVFSALFCFLSSLPQLILLLAENWYANSFRLQCSAGCKILFERWTQWITGWSRGAGIGMEERSTKGGAALPFAARLKAFSSCPLWVLTQRDLWWGWSLTPIRPHYVNECTKQRDDTIIFLHTHSLFWVCVCWFLWVWIQWSDWSQCDTCARLKVDIMCLWICWALLFYRPPSPVYVFLFTA